MLRFVRPRDNPNAVVVEIARADGVPDAAEMLQPKWLVFDGRISIGESRDCAIPLPESKAGDAAEIWFENGFWITPAFNVRLTIADAPFTEQTPIPAGTEICIGEATLQVAASSAALEGREPATAEVIPLRVISV
jgi:hypothetical protein